MILSFNPSIVSLAIHERSHFHAGNGIFAFAAVHLADNELLAHIDHSACQISRSPLYEALYRTYPFRAPCADIKYSNTSSPSRKLDLIGSSIVRPVVSAISPRIPASCLICWLEPRAPESGHHKDVVVLVKTADQLVGQRVIGLFHVSTTAL